MKTRLNLTIDDSLIEDIKAYAPEPAFKVDDDLKRFYYENKAGNYEI